MMLRMGVLGGVLLAGLRVWSQEPADVAAAKAKIAARQATTRELLMAHATPLSLADAPYQESEYAPLLGMVRGKKLVLVSEPTHGTHECRLENAKLVRALVEKDGVRTLIVELGYTEGLELDAYVRRGVGEADAIVSKDLGTLWNTVEEAEMMRWIAGWNKAHPKQMVRVIGMDVESGAAAGLSLAKLVAGVKIDPALQERVRVGAEAASKMNGVARPTSTEEEKRSSESYDAALVELLAAVKALPASSQREDAWRAAMSVRSGRLAAEMRLEGRDGNDAGARLREFEMARMVLTVLPETDVPTVIVTHTVHLRAGRLEGDKVQSVGYHLARALGDRAFFLGEEYGTGSMRAYEPAPPGTPPQGRKLHAAKLDPPMPGSVAAALGDTTPLLIDLRDPRDGSKWSEWLETMQATHLYPAITYADGYAAQPNWTVPADAFDALVYLPTVRPLRPIGAPEYVP